MPPRCRAAPPPQHRLRGCYPSRECTSYEGAAAIAGLANTLRRRDKISGHGRIDERLPTTALHQLRGCRRTNMGGGGTEREFPGHYKPGYVNKAFSTSVVATHTNQFDVSPTTTSTYAASRREYAPAFVSLGRTDYAANAGCLNQTAVRLESEKMEAMMPPCTKYEGAHDDIIW
eukprot:CAMPEP_0178682268 /NCGR_PEP_ID=MMETSP0699-20121125/1680_1 /TAXON_ID=265572 /ORGANISM="Extubocellulus spinifer, Strain CCMP396" /LENGTH=173 /DNA_ID=CAMNT_0020326785 /DNA_START=1131 /DNA_END=1650 /DNA_ORIENTATION=-